MLRILLPPNLAAAAARDAIPLRVELDLSGPPPDRLLPALAILQRIGLPATPVAFIQVTRDQLRELLNQLTQERVFHWVNRPAAGPLPWNGLDLPGVSEHLVVRAAPPPLPPPPGPAPKPSPVRRAPAEPKRRLEPMAVDGSEHYLAITLPSRESVLYQPALDLLKEHRFALDPLTRKWWLRDRHKVLNFLAARGAELRERYEASLTPNFERNTAHLKTAEVTAEVAEQADGYEVTIGLRAGDAAEGAVRDAVSAGRGYVEHGGAVYLVDPGRLRQLEAAQSALAGERGAGAAGRRRHRIPRARVAEANDVLAELAPGFQPPESWRARSASLHQLSNLRPAPMSAELAARLRPYQQLGAAWLWYLYREGLGGILADEMGLGKTAQALALLTAAKRARPGGHLPHLVVAPASLLENWRREAERFAPELRVHVHHGEDRPGAEALQSYDVVVTSYGILRRDTELLAGCPFDLIIADEAQHLKNRGTQAAQSLRELHGQGRFLLTGTPLENSLDDLRSLFEFLMPGLLPPLPPGLAREDRAWHDENLRARTAPFILRRRKSEVAPELPDKIEQVIYCEPTPAQNTLYRDLQEESERALIDLAARGASEGALRMATLTHLLRLRQLCCDPRLLPGESGRAAAESSKLEAFRELLDEATDENRRMLVFSQFTSLLDLLAAELEAQGLPYCRLDGSMRPAARQEQVDRFQEDESVPVFLISLKAGGTGLNLTGADIVVHFDPWWNPAAEAQATDRAHRIGQTKVVTSYKLICAGTVEEKVLALQDAKRALLADVFEASDALSARLSLDDLKALLK